MVIEVLILAIMVVPQPLTEFSILPQNLLLSCLDVGLGLYCFRRKQRHYNDHNLPECQPSKQHEG